MALLMSHFNFDSFCVYNALIAHQTSIFASFISLVFTISLILLTVIHKFFPNDNERIHAGTRS